MIAVKLAAEFRERHGVQVVVDTQVYNPAGLTRLYLSIHSGVKAFSIPFRPEALTRLTWDGIRRRQRSPRYVLAVARSYGGLWGRIVEPEKYMRVPGFYLALKEANLRLEVRLPSPREVRTNILVAGGGLWTLSSGLHSSSILSTCSNLAPDSSISLYTR